MKTYKLFIEYWYGKIVDIIQTNDLYHYVGELFLSSINKIERIDYKELGSVNDCQYYKPICEQCMKRRICNKWSSVN